MVRSEGRTSVVFAVALAAVIAGAIALMHFKAARDDAAAIVAPAQAASAKSERASSALELPLPSADVTRVAPAEAQHASAARPSDDVTVLHVQVVDKSDAAITSGMLECNWRASVEKPASGRVNARIAGATTDVTLPKEASLCTVTASAAGFPPVQVTAAGFRGNRKSGPITGRVDHDVRIVLGNTNTGTTLSGAIIVNGERRVPDGLNIIVDSTIGRALVNQVDATYVVAVGLENVPAMLRVDSDDSPTQQFQVPDAGADGNRHLDLKLETKRTLHVHAVDDATGAPASGVKLSCYMRVLAEDSVLRRTFNERTSRRTSDAQGNCDFRSLPDDGLVQLSETKDELSDIKPLFAVTLTRESPADFNETVRVNTARASVWGNVPASPGSRPGVASSYHVVRARRLASGAASGDERPVDQDAAGRWSFECEAPSDWFVWLTSAGVRVSQVERVLVDVARSIGPVQLALAPLHDVTLRMIDLPPNGTIAMFISDVAGGPSQREIFGFTGPELAHVLHVQGPVRVNIHSQTRGPGSKTEFATTVTIDPRVTPEVVVDMHDEHARRAEITLNGVPPVGETVLSFIALDDTGARAGQFSNFALTDGKSDSATALPGGRYMYWLNTDKHRGLICGIVNVAEPADESLVRIDWRGNEIPRERLGAGVELVSVDGFSCANLNPFEKQVRWSLAWGADVKTLLMPDKCEYTVLK
jgi:hypothetical protein